MRYIRFVLHNRHRESGVRDGLFATAYALRDSTSIEEPNRLALTEVLAWFESHLATPPRFNRSTSKGHYRRATKGIAWFKATAADHMRRMHEMSALLEVHGHAVSHIVESRVGYIVYEDEHQVVAEPFGDTRTG